MSYLLGVKDLKKWFFLKKSFFQRNVTCIKAVDGVTFGIEKGDVFGLVGESGSGKSTIARLILFLEKPSSGFIKFDGNIIDGSQEELLKKYRIQVGAVFQDPFDSLNPMMNLFATLREPLDIVDVGKSKTEKIEAVEEALKEMKLTPTDEFMQKYPHELSGGQRQRASVARALMLKPRLLVADEPLSMLDVSLRADILNLIGDIQKKYKLTVLFITHDLAVARYFCDDVGVIYKGKLMEKGPSGQIFKNPIHPYTIALKEAIPEIGKDVKSPDVGYGLQDIEGGCPYRPRCGFADAQCVTTPEMIEVSPGHSVACFKI